MLAKCPNISKTTLKEYALRQLGKPVLDINVDDDQIDDIIDDALQYFAEYHYDGTIRTYLKHQINDTDLANQKCRCKYVTIIYRFTYI